MTNSTRTVAILGRFTAPVLVVAGTAILGAEAAGQSMRPAADRTARVFVQEADETLPPIIEDRSRIDTYELATLDLPAGLPFGFSVEVPFEGSIVDLDLTALSIRSESFRLFVDHGDGTLVDTPAELPRTYRGAADEPGSLVSASLLDDGLHAIVYREDRSELVIQPASVFGLDLPAGTHVIYDSAAASAEGHCGNDLYDLPGNPAPEGPPPPSGDGGVAGGTLELVELGIEADYEFFQRNSSSVATTLNDLELVMNNIDTIYNRDVNIAYELTTIVIRSDSNDPYTSSTIDGRLNQFVNVWGSSPENEILRDHAHMFSGFNFSGGTIGLAYVGVICNASAYYGVSESRYTSNLTFRTSLTAHELGHNWSSQHCDSNTPCHIMCSSNGGCNGISGSNLKFGNAAQNQIINHRNSRSCLIDLGDSIVPPFLDQFEASPNNQNWIHQNGVSVNTVGTNEPSGTRSLNLDATSGNLYGDDEIRTNEVVLNVPQAFVSYYYQHKGVESGESLFVEYQNQGNDWVVIGEHVSDGVDMTDYTFVQIELPSAARYNGVRFRIRVDVNQSNDDWFVDDFSISEGPTSTVENDECDSPTAITSNTTVFSTEGATSSGIDDTLSCSSSSGPAVDADIWFSYVATCTGPLEFSTCGAADFDARLSLYLADSGCPSSGTAPLACSDDDCGDQPFVSTFGIAGASYLLRIGSSDGSTGSGILTVDCGGFPAPPNDECDGAETVATGATPISTLGATSSGIDSALFCSSSSGPTVQADVWFLYTADCTGELSIATCGVDFDSRVDVYQAASGCPSSGDGPVVCGDDVGCGDDVLVTTLALEGTQYLIRIGSPDGTTGSGDLLIACEPFEEPCPEDLNGDGEVNGADLGLLLGAWGNANGDLNGDGVTNGADLGLMLGAWGGC